MKESNVHDFHFMMNRGMKERLHDVQIGLECRGLSGLVVKILGVLTPVIRDEHKWGEQRMAQYRSVCNDPDDVREHIHAYMPWEVYRELKLLHQDLNVYSIAQLLRGFLEWFLVFYEGCEGDVWVELERLFAGWFDEDKECRLTTHEYLRQLFTIIQHLPGDRRLVTIYNQQFSPFWILRM